MPKSYDPTKRGTSASQIADIANGVMDPLLAKKAGINSMLLGVWGEIVGPDFADDTRPEKIVWPPRSQNADHNLESGGGLQPGTLTIACEGARALFFSHQQNEVMARINSFLGFPAIARIKIVQKSIVKHEHLRKKPRKISPSEQKELNSMISSIEDDRLSAALEKLGRAVLSAKRT